MFPILAIFSCAAVALGVARFAKQRAARRLPPPDFKPEIFGTQINSFDLEKDGTVQYAQWQHPKESPKEISQSSIDVLRQYIYDGDTVIDIGAHTGDTTLPMALAAGASGCTIALEPNPYVFAVLQQNATLNTAKTNISALNIAATQEDGDFTFHYSDAAFCNGGYLSRIKNQKHGHHFPLQVQGRNLETILRRDFSSRLAKLSYIKIDTEGYDRDVIISLDGILREFHPVIVTEVLKKLARDERESLFDALTDAGYKCFKLEAGASMQGEPIERGDMMKWKSFDILALPDEAAHKTAG